MRPEADVGYADDLDVGDVINFEVSSMWASESLHASCLDSSISVVPRELFANSRNLRSCVHQ